MLGYGGPNITPQKADASERQDGGIPWFEMKKCSFSEERRRRYCDEHQAILDCLVRRAPECAKNAMLAQLKTVERNLLGR